MQASGSSGLKIHASPDLFSNTERQAVGKLQRVHLSFPEEKHCASRSPKPLPGLPQTFRARICSAKSSRSQKEDMLLLSGLSISSCKREIHKPKMSLRSPLAHTRRFLRISSGNPSTTTLFSSQHVTRWQLPSLGVVKSTRSACRAIRSAHDPMQGLGTMMTGTNSHTVCIQYTSHILQQFAALTSELLVFNRNL